jgi:TDG/mug DNA glycosylase family protein
LDQIDFLMPTENRAYIDVGMNRLSKPSASLNKQAKPSKADLLAATDKTVPDVIAPGLKLLFCGINPGLYSAYTGDHFARPGNRFWPALFASGLTPRLLHPNEEHELLQLGFGITNLVDRATLAADELTKEELLSGANVFRRKLKKYKPGVVAILGVSAYRIAFDSPGATTGLQAKRIFGTEVWVLPNPSGLNAHFTPKALAKVFRSLRLHVDRSTA